MNNIDVIIVEVPNMKRSVPLLETLSRSSRLNVTIFSAIMFSRDKSCVKPNYSKQKILYGRELSDGEVGCAISHWNIYQNYVQNERICVILEDDARIPDVSEFENLIFEFQNQFQNENAILSLLPWRKEKCDLSENLIIHKLFGHSPLTVGYVITPKAMRELLSANMDFSFLPDWPPVSSSFYITLRGVIDHGDAFTYSLIDKGGREKGKKERLIRNFLLITYFQNLEYFTNFRDYFKSAILPSISWRIDKLFMELIRLVR